MTTTWIGLLTSLYYLAEKYNIKDLMVKINSQGFKVAKDNVMNVGVLGEQNVLLTPLSDALYDAAAVFLSNYFKNRLDMAFIYFSEVEASPINSQVIHKLMSKIALIVTKLHV